MDNDYVVVDTNVLLNYPDIIKNKKVLLHSSVLEELDNFKTDKKLSYKARQAIKMINNNIDNIRFDNNGYAALMPWGYNVTKVDNNLVYCAKDNHCKLITNDINMQVKAKLAGVEVESYGNNDNEEYKGYKIVELTDEELAEFYESDKTINKWNLLNNEYLLLKQNGEIIDKYKWTKDGFKNITKKTLKSSIFGDIKPKDVFQEIAIDSLLTDDFTILYGIAGVAKTLLSLSYMLMMQQSGKFDKIVIVYNPVNLLGSKSLGYYPGDRLEKLMSTSLGGILTSKFGDAVVVDMLINQGKLALIPVSEIRGIEISENSCLYATEVQNMDAYMVKNLIQRVKEGAKIILEGDISSRQVDMQNCSGENNGLRRAIEVFKGTDYFSCVQLQNVYRSPISEIAEKM